MAVLVTGGAGYIGSHTCIELLQAGFDVVIMDNLSNSSAESVRRLEELAGKKVKLYERDIRDEAAYDAIFGENDIEAVIHFAGLKAVGESCRKPIEYYDNNIGGTVKLLEAMKKHGAVYFAAVGGAAALMASCVTSLEVICWDDLGPESIKRLTLHELPLAVAIDAQGNDAFRRGQAEYLASIHE